MDKSEFHFDLPEHLIAQVPIKNRVKSKLMIIDKENQTIRSDYFEEVYNLINKDDVLVLNYTNVIL